MILPDIIESFGFAKYIIIYMYTETDFPRTSGCCRDNLKDAITLVRMVEAQLGVFNMTHRRSA